jgi:integrase
VVDVDPRTVAALKAHRAALAALDLRLARDDALVLPSNAGEVRHPERFSRAFASRVRRARVALGDDALPVIRLHDLRHSHATALQIGGIAFDASFDASRDRRVTRTCGFRRSRRWVEQVPRHAG